MQKVFSFFSPYCLQKLLPTVTDTVGVTVGNQAAVIVKTVYSPFSTQIVTGANGAFFYFVLIEAYDE
jgi:hypothetical protein